MGDNNKRGQWGSSIGFVLAAAGSAIGLGNIWKFPYLLGQNGGFLFLICYLIFIAVLGIPVMLGEFALGRRTQLNPLGAYRKIDKRFSFVGVMAILTPFLIVSYYNVIGGWVIKYIVSSPTGAAANLDFGAFIGGTEALVWHLIFAALVVFFCAKGASSIEAASKVMMPSIFIILIVVIIRSVTLPGATEGLKFMFANTDPEAGFSFAKSVPAALGQCFFSLSLGMGAMITYGSYLNKQENLPKQAIVVPLLDTSAALMAGFAIFPAVFAMGIEPNSGAGLAFMTLPKVFEKMPAGGLFGTLFFVLLLFAALTSAISLLECTISFTMDEWNWSRNKSLAILGVSTTVLGAIYSLCNGSILGGIMIGPMTIGGWMEFIPDYILMPIGGMLMCIMIGWVWKFDEPIREITNDGRIKFSYIAIWKACIKWLSPLLILAVFIIKLVEFLGSLA